MTQAGRTHFHCTPVSEHTYQSVGQHLMIRSHALYARYEILELQKHLHMLDTDFGVGLSYLYEPCRAVVTIFEI